MPSPHSVPISVGAVIGAPPFNVNRDSRRSRLQALTLAAQMAVSSQDGKRARSIAREVARMAHEMAAQCHDDDDAPPDELRPLLAQARHIVSLVRGAVLPASPESVEVEKAGDAVRTAMAMAG